MGIHAYITFITWVAIVDFNTSHHSNHIRLLICYKGHIVDNKTVQIVYVAICARSYHIMTILLHQTTGNVTYDAKYMEPDLANNVYKIFAHQVSLCSILYRKPERVAYPILIHQNHGTISPLQRS